MPPPEGRPLRIISGGQTGVDRAALDGALSLGLPCGGFCPSGRRAEDGPIPADYPLSELPSPRYEDRTERNVLAADATLVLTVGEPQDGTALTIDIARRRGKPLLVVRLERPERSVDRARAWLESGTVGTLNVAGPRESSAPGVYALASRYLRALFAGPINANPDHG